MTIYIVFTFDDFSRDASVKINEILRHINVKGTFFLNTAVIQNDDEEIIKELAKYHEIGSHSHNHLDLTLLSFDEVLQDLLKSREILQNLSGKSIKSFAYPYGKWDNKVVKAVKKAGFIIARTIDVKPPLTEIKEPLKLPVFFHDYPLTDKRLIYEILKNFLIGKINIAKLYEIMYIEKRESFLKTAKSLLDSISNMYHHMNILIIFLIHPWMIDRVKDWDAFEEVVLLAKNIGRIITLEEAYERFYVKNLQRDNES